MKTNLRDRAAALCRTLADRLSPTEEQSDTVRHEVFGCKDRNDIDKEFSNG